MTKRIGVGIIVICKGKVLLLRRATKPEYGMWAVPGGLMEDGELPETTARRELKEETGLEANVLIEVLPRRLAPNDPGIEATVFYIMESGIDNVKLSDEHTGYIWVSPRDLPSNISPLTILKIGDASKNDQLSSICLA